MTRLLAMLSMLGLTIGLMTAAQADTEASEHTAQLVGDAADTLGVTIKFDDAVGWSMLVRAKPGAPEKTFVLASLGKRHAHYVVYVTPGRGAIVFVEVSTGTTDKRAKLSPKDVVASVWSPADGKLVRSWTFGQVFTQAELDKLPRSISHISWTDGSAVTKAGLELTVAGGAKRRTVVIDPKAASLR